MTASKKNTVSLEKDEKMTEKSVFSVENSLLL